MAYRAHKLVEGFEKANSDNLPEVNIITLAKFIAKDNNFISPEISNIKAMRNGRESYGESAIGYVQLKREGHITTVISCVAPEHKVASTGYKVEIVVDNLKGEITLCKCYGCIAALGGCKHQLALLGWMHRRFEDKTPTEKECYWKKSKLSNVGKTIKFILAKDLGAKVRERKHKNSKKNLQSSTPFLKAKHPRRIHRNKSEVELKRKLGSRSFLQEVINHMECKLKQEVTVIPELAKIFLPVDAFDSIDIHCLSRDFKKEYSTSKKVDDFLTFCKSKMTDELCNKVAECTSDQKDNPLWRRLRYLRITASNLYAVAHCKTMDGSLIEILHGAKLRETSAMARGIRLEPQVLEVVSNKLAISFERCGLMIHQNHPIFGASPDGINKDFIVEIKCPSNDKSYFDFIDAAGKIKPKCKAQVQLQMHLSGRKKSFFCVASPQFEKNKKVKILKIDYDEHYILAVMVKAENFWKAAIGNFVVQ